MHNHRHPVPVWARYALAAVLCTALAGPPALADDDAEPALHNPYADIDWDAVNQYKGAFHVHIRTQYHPEAEIVQQHEEYGFDIFARTDASWSHPEEHADEMLVIPGREMRNTREHTIHLFEPRDNDLGSYAAVEQAGGIQWRAHPHDPGRATYSREQILEHFQTYDTMIGMEIISRNHYPQPGRGDDVHNHRRGKGNYTRVTRLWDYFLAEHDMLDIHGVGVTDGYNDMLPEFRPDDTFFGQSIYNTGWSLVLAEQRDIESIKHAMQNGHMFWVSNMDDAVEPPEVSRITHDNTGIEIEIDGDYDEIRWIYRGQTIHTGPRFDFDDERLQDDQNYVRFELWTNTDDFYDSDIVGSQAFGVPQR